MLKLSAASLEETRVDLLAVPVCEDAALADQPLVKKTVARALALKEFKGEKNQEVLFYDLPGTRIQRCLLIGVGPRDKVDLESLRAFAGQAIRSAICMKVSDLCIAPPLAEPLGIDPRAALKAVMEGAVLANQVLDTYKQKPSKQAVKTVSLLVPKAAVRNQAALVKEVETVCQCTLRAREWVNTPANRKLPELFAAELAAEAGRAGLNVEILNEAQLKQKKFGALLAVAGGSDHPPRLVEMVYNPAGAKKSLVLVGKGVTFDTGGINLKPSANLEAMKADMAGAAAVAAAMLAVARLKPRMRIAGIMPLVENMPSGSAARPGDIVTSYSGKTIEIGNTDAEGRLILADAMAYAVKKHKPDILVDLATLTGACVVALGDKMAAVFSEDDQLVEAVTAAGRATHERCWHMPMPEDYKELLKSELADIGNMPSTRNGAAISAALFLSEFTGETRWAHIDIAGPAYLKQGGDTCPPGATGFGVRLLWELIANLA